MILTYLETHDWLTNAAAREIVHVGTTSCQKPAKWAGGQRLSQGRRGKPGKKILSGSQKDRDEDIRR